MIIAELLGYKQSKALTLDELISKLTGTGIASGLYAYVISPRDKPYVWKLWYQDPGYETYLKICMKLQDNPFVPKIIKAPKEIRLHTKLPSGITPLIRIVKLEKLHHNSSSFTHGTTIRLIKQLMLPSRANVLKNSKLSIDSLKQYIIDEGIMSNNELLSEIGLKLDDLLQLCVELISSNANLLTDLHEQNYMFRGDGQLVITDPFISDKINDIVLDDLSKSELTKIDPYNKIFS